MNATLEGMAQALFKSWFVDFDPVIDNALAAGNPIPDELAPRACLRASHRQAEVRRQALSDRKTGTTQQGSFDNPTLSDRQSLFPDAFQKTESMGWIPEGWEETCVGNHVSLQRGTTYKSKLKGLPGPYLLGLGAIQRNGGFKEGKLMTYGGESPAKITIGPGGIFVSLKDLTQAADLLGSVARIPPHIASGRLTQDTVALVFDKAPISKDYLYNALLTPRYRDYCRNYSTGTTNLGLAREDFFSYPVPKPGHSVQEIYDNFVSGNQKKHEVNTAEANSLTKLRDTLLPRLIAGVLRIDIEKLEEVAE
jgi:restriction endonuclease S subunit